MRPLLLCLCLVACGAQAQQGRHSTLVYTDPLHFTDGTPIPDGVLTRRVYCGLAPGEYRWQTVVARRTALAGLMQSLNLPYDVPVFCVAVAQVAGVTSASSNEVVFRCTRSGPNTICFPR